MSAFDGNRDGFVNRLEANDQREFQQGDRNRDGALNFQEFARTDSKLIDTSWRSISAHSFLLSKQIHVNSANTIQTVMV